MNIWLTVIIILSATFEQAYQSCISLNVLPPIYYSRFSRVSLRTSTAKKYIECNNEVISSDFSEKVLPLTTNSQIQWLQINNTNSPEIPAKAFVMLKNIPDLRINGAGVQLIQPGAFDGLTSLTQLSLKDNKIVEVNERHFIELIKLVELDLSYNNIASISETSFVGLKDDVIPLLLGMINQILVNVLPSA
ncbi:hypothetical protein Zmor_006190 [Zophobas morio]|uniref:Uncharacterized protein n=1 Tax=Zophobas morio TaxID=2755281 RepID=A0AA38MN44_9CUCU|nr:hypothetical protein Zmor_006190 [Zophobas morio]